MTIATTENHGAPLAVRTPAPLAEKLQYAERLAESDIVPKAYRGKVANILIAGELGERLGLSWAEALYRIDVIDGKPSLSAELIVSKVREAGHKLRLAYDQPTRTAVCSIWRSDDPDFEYRAEWSWERANSISDPSSGKKLTDKANWRNYYPAMLRWRSATECANAACPEALWGMGRMPDELGAQELTDAEADDMGVMTRHQRVEHTELQRMVKDDRPRLAERLHEADPDDPWTAPAETPVFTRLDELVRRLDLGPAEDVQALFEWLTGAPWTGTRSQIDQAYSWLDDHLQAANGDVNEAASNAWKQYREANPQAGDDGA